jgi:hypothetical protein
MIFYVRVPVDVCLIDPELNQTIYDEQNQIWWIYTIFHLIAALVMIFRERNEIAEVNYLYEITMQIINIT